jgi:Putative beta-barrel porin 2
MTSGWMRALCLLALAPTAALAFDTVDTLRYPSSGAFPGWPSDIPSRPWSVFAYAGAMYDSNPFRLENAEQSDIVARYGAGATMVTRVVGRQRVLLEGFGEYYDYDRFSEIDNFGYGLRGEWLWEIGNALDGVVGYSRRHRHADLGEFRVETRSMITTDRYVVNGGYRLTPSWLIFVRADHTHEERDFGFAPETDSSGLLGSLTYRTGLGNTVGVLVRQTAGEARAANAGGVVSLIDYDETEVAATLGYSLGEQLRVRGRLGHTERTYDDAPQFDFSGTTYRGAVDWLPTGKLTFTVEAYREPESSLEFDATQLVRQGATFGAAWAMTYKLVLSARFLNERRKYQGDPGNVVLALPPRDETVRIWRFAAGWEIQRNWQLGAGVDFGERDSNRAGDDYDYVQVMASLRWRF